MLGIRSLTVIRPRACLTITRSYAAQTPAKKANKPDNDISQIPLNQIFVLTDYYIPPKFKDCPISSWPKLFIRKLGTMAFSTYSVFRYKMDTKRPIKFNLWKDKGIENFVRVNKSFANACSKKVKERSTFLNSQLSEVAAVPVISSLAERAATFPAGGRTSWELISIEGNPKIVNVLAIPDKMEVTCYVQMVMKLSTKQKFTVKLPEKNITEEKVLTDYLVFTVHPFTDEVMLSGKLFESDHLRKITPELAADDMNVMKAFMKATSDIYRTNPRAKE
ncbi:mitochondrial inner membrane protein Mba1 [Scheffersomyces amazonensis]|uniref:mitochondrial inner membrane protein Mba1 n=1 Tax=Scheffersomyces amazonensis TaxID=1078765 RepID=UPI00315DA810